MMRRVVDVVLVLAVGLVAMAQAEMLSPGMKRINLTLPDLPPGWYEVAMVMQSQGTFVGEQTMDDGGESRRNGWRKHGRRIALEGVER